MLKNLLGKLRQEQEEYVVLEKGEEEKTGGKIQIHVERLSEYGDSERLQQKIRDGHIMLIKIRDLRQKDMNELKRAVNRIRKTCLALEGDIAGLGDDWLIVTSSAGRIHRQQVEE